MGIKHIFYENGVTRIFKLIVPEGNYQGEYEIGMPDGWGQSDSIVNVDEEQWFVKDFIIGDNVKLRFWEVSNKIAFNLLKNVYNEQKGDGHVVFKWIAVKDGVEHDLLKDNFEVNFNKYNELPGKSMMKIEIELIKSEARNKLFNRDDTTIDLFAEKDLDENTINPVNTFTLGYKKGDKVLSNFYNYDQSQFEATALSNTFQFPSFVRSEDHGFGDNTNDYCGYKNYGLVQKYQGPFVYTNITLKKIKIEITNFHVYLDSNSGPPTVNLHAVIKGPNVDAWIHLKQSELKTEGGVTFSEIKIDRDVYDLKDYVNLLPGQTLDLVLTSDVKFIFQAVKTNTTIEITSNMESPMVKTNGIRLIDGLGTIIRNYTSSQLNIASNFIGPGGTYYNTSISTGIYLRGLPSAFTIGQKIKSSFKSMFSDGAAKLLTLGFDILNDTVIVEDINYFFKDLRFYDLTNKDYIFEGFKVESDKDVTFNSLLFGGKKYSTKIKDDIRNFITTAEFSTPIKSVKNKFDKQTELIIDEYKIQELIEDKTSSTNDNDDDLVMIDMVEQTNYWDYGIFDNCIHSFGGGYLVLTCTEITFDTTMIEAGTQVEITEGINAGTWNVVAIDGPKIALNKTTGVQEGIADTPIRYRVNSVIKNRALTDGFGDPDYIRNPETSTNARHNPKYHMARWFPYFGSGLTAKKDNEPVKVTNYKNEERAQMRAYSTDLDNELQGLVVVGQDEPLSRLRDNAPALFSGDKIEISYTRVSFEEFIIMYENWRYGAGGDRANSRGYITLNTPLGIYDVFPYGDGAFSHNGYTNVLSIKGKIKGRAVENPELLTVEQIDKNTISLTWDYSDEYITPEIKIQYSLNNDAWITLKTVVNVKADTFSSDVFDQILTGAEVKFRILVNTSDFYNRSSNIISKTWQFNDFIIVEAYRAENFNCGNSNLIFDIYGASNFNVQWTFISEPGGGGVRCLDYTGPDQINIQSPKGADYTKVENTIITVEDWKRFEVRLNNTSIVDNNILLTCFEADVARFVRASLEIKLTHTVTMEEKVLYLEAATLKYEP